MHQDRWVELKDLSAHRLDSVPGWRYLSKETLVPALQDVIDSCAVAVDDDDVVPQLHPVERDVVALDTFGEIVSYNRLDVIRIDIEVFGDQRPVFFALSRAEVLMEPHIPKMEAFLRVCCPHVRRSHVAIYFDDRGAIYLVRETKVLLEF